MSVFSTRSVKAGYVIIFLLSWVPALVWLFCVKHFRGPMPDATVGLNWGGLCAWFALAMGLLNGLSGVLGSIYWVLGRVGWSRWSRLGFGYLILSALGTIISLWPILSLIGLLDFSVSPSH